MPWEPRWVPKNPKVPPYLPPKMTGGDWTEVYVATPAEQEAANRAAAARRSAASRAKQELATATEPSHIALLISALREVRDYETIHRAWSDLVARGVAGSPTHELIEFPVSRKPAQLLRTELCRSPVWRARKAGRYGEYEGEGYFSVYETDEHSMDVWLARDGRVWMPYLPPYTDGGFAQLPTDAKGRVYEPDPLVIVTRRGGSPRTRRERLFSNARAALLDGVVVAWNRGVSDPFSPRCDLGDAVVAALRHN